MILRKIKPDSIKRKNTYTKDNAQYLKERRVNRIQSIFIKRNKSLNFESDWGARATEFRFDAVKNGTVVKQVRRSAVTALKLDVTPSHTVLRHGATYDAALLRLAVTDQNGNVAPFWHGAADVEIRGPLELIGPARATLRGGLGGVYVKTIGQPGEATVTVKTDQTEPVSLRFIIKTEKQDNETI